MTKTSDRHAPGKQDVRLDVRLSRELNAMIDEAACLAGVTKSAFVKATLADAAARVRREHTSFELTPEETAWLVEELRRPPSEPNPLLLAAIAKYSKVITSERDSRPFEGSEGSRMFAVSSEDFESEGTDTAATAHQADEA